MKEIFRVRRSSAIKLLLAVNCKNASTYAPLRLKAKLHQLPDLIGDGDAAAIEDVATRKLLQAVVSAVARGYRLRIEENL